MNRLRIHFNINAGCFSRAAVMAAMVGLFLALSVNSLAAESEAQVQVQLDAKKAGPRAVESLTEHAIVRDYRIAWSSIAHALEFNVIDPLEGPFAGDAKRMVKETVASQQKSGLRQRYLDQNHKLEAVFYSPEGDVIELHDTVEYQQQLLDGGKLIQDQHMVLHYVVLMTPSADRWVVRQLQAVPRF
jgi:hypothetical protein